MYLKPEYCVLEWSKLCFTSATKHLSWQGRPLNFTIKISRRTPVLRQRLRIQTALNLDHPLTEGQKSLSTIRYQIFRQIHNSLRASVAVRMTGKQNTCGKTLFRVHFCQIPLFSTDFITELMWRKCLKTLWHNMGRAGSLSSCIMNPTVCCKQLSSCKQVVFLSSPTLLLHSRKFFI